MKTIKQIQTVEQIIKFLELCLDNIKLSSTGLCNLYKNVLMEFYDINDDVALDIVYKKSIFIHLHNKFYANQMIFPIISSNRYYDYWWKEIFYSIEALNYRIEYIKWMISVYKKIKQDKTYDVIFHTDLYGESYAIYIDIPNKTAIECFDYITNELNNHNEGKSTLIKEYSDKFGCVSVICLETKELIMSIPLYDVWNVKEPEYGE